MRGRGFAFFRAKVMFLMKGRLRLAVDARDLATDVRGIGRYARAVLRRIAQDEDVDLTLLAHGPFPFLQRKRLAQSIDSEDFRMSSAPRRCDAVWHPGNGTFFQSALPAAVTIHDAVPFRYPDPDSAKRKHQQDPFLRSIASASRVIAVSAFGRDEICDIFGFPQERVDVIHHGVDPFFIPGGNLEVRDKPYFLFVGDPAEHRKNFSVLRAAHERAFNGGGPALTIVGPPNPAITDDQLRELYRGALALCVPSYYEGYGMPAIEAMACGTPVLSARASCLPEVCGDAALYAPPDDPQAWAALLRQIASQQDLRAQMRTAGLAWIGRYNWDESARRHAEVFKSLVSRK